MIMNQSMFIFYSLFWITSHVGWTVSAVRCDVDRIRSQEKYTNITVDLEKCLAIVETSPGNRIVFIFHSHFGADYLKIYDGNSTESSEVVMRIYSSYTQSLVSKSNKLFIKGEDSFLYDCTFLLSTMRPSYRDGIIITVMDDNITAEIADDKCTILAETLPGNNMVAVPYISKLCSRDCISLPCGYCPVILAYDGNYGDGTPIVIPLDRSFATRGNIIAIRCIYNCDKIPIEFHRIASTRFLSMSVEPSSRIDLPRYRFMDPGYPAINEDLPYNFEISWVFISIRRATLTLTFLETRLPSTCLDILKIESSDGFTEDLCGSLATPIKYHLTSDNVTITFALNSDYSSAGFTLQYNACQKEFWDKSGIIFLPTNEAGITLECHFTVYVEEMDTIRLYFLSKLSPVDNDTCSSTVTVLDGETSPHILYNGCVFRNSPKFVQATSRTLSVTVILNDQLDIIKPLLFYTAFDEEVIPIKMIIIVNLGIVIVFLTMNVIFWIRFSRQRSNTAHQSSLQSNVVIDNNAVYNLQEEITENPYDECE